MRRFRTRLRTTTAFGQPSLSLDFLTMAASTFDNRIDFTRTSSATYVDATGKIVSTPASRNLLTFTQEFDNAVWTKNNVTITTNSTAAPDGTLTAETLTASANAAVHNVTQAGGASGVQQTFSVYAKAGTSSFVQLWHGAAASIYANFNVSTGVVGTVGAGATATISSAGNGWYRCTITCTPGLTNQFRAAMVTSTTAAYAESWPAAGTETIFLWGAQLEAGSTATDYTRNNGGVYPPRFDYDPVTLAPKGLLVEEQRTNLLVRSEAFDNAGWGKANPGVAVLPVVTANAGISPDGTMDADRVQFDCGDNTSQTNRSTLTQGVTVSSGTAYRGSLYIKAYDAGNVGKTVRITSDSIGTTITTLTADWKRVEWGGTAASTSSNVVIECRGTYTTQTADVLIWGAQLEAGAFATSYIPTVASQVTRSADVASMTGTNFSQFYNQSEGTLLVEGSVYSTGLSGNRKTLAVITEGNFNNASRTAVEGATSAGASVISGGVTQAGFIVGSAVTANTPFKMALAMKANDFAFCANGGAVSTDTSGSVVAAPIVLDLGFGPQNSSGSTNTAGDQLNGHLRSLRYYPAKLTNAQLQALTA